MSRIAAILVVLVLAGPGPGAAHAPSRPRYPPSRVDDVVENIHGTGVHDPYRWLEDGTSAEVRSWIRDQNAFAREDLDALAGRDRLERRLREVSFVDTVSTPQRAGGRLFHLRRRADQNKPVLVWREGDSGAEHVLVDSNTLSADGTTSLGSWEPSKDGRTIAYGLREHGADEATLHVADVATGKESVIDRIPGARYADPQWTPAGDGFYYTWLPTDPAVPAAQRPGHAEIRFHALGTDPAHDRVVRPATGNAGEFLNCLISPDGHWLFSLVQTFSRDEVSFRDLRSAASPWKTLVAGVDAHFTPAAYRDRFYVLTDDGASRYRLMRADPAHPDRARWTEIVPESSDAVLQDASVVGGQLALTWLRNAASEIELRTLDGRTVRKVALPGVGASGGIRGNPDDAEGYYAFSSFTRSPEVHAITIETGATTLWWKQNVPVDPEPYTVEQVFYHSKDGTRIPMFLVHRKDMRRDGSTPFLLTGYGGFGVSEQPYFSAQLYPWLEAGGGYAVADLRGGGEYGEAWHRAGALANKQNVFDDFAAAAGYLVRRRYTQPRRLAIRGASNGGLLMGAALTQHPELYKAVVCEVPLLDMVRYNRFGSGATWVSEYGDPARAADFAWLYAYSPYHHVRKGTRYPAVLFNSADHDDRVDPLHARKMTAALQAASIGGPVLLRIQANAGHTGADMVSSAVASALDVYAFLFDQLAVNPSQLR